MNFFERVDGKVVNILEYHMMLTVQYSVHQPTPIKRMTRTIIF